MNFRIRIYTWAFLSIIVLFITACGGGSSGLTVSSSPYDALVPKNPPSAASPSYSGNKSAANITENNSLDFGLGAQRGLDLAATLINLIGVQQYPSNYGVIYQKNSGWLEQGRLNSDGIGWILSTYTNDNIGHLYVVNTSPDLNTVHHSLIVNGRVLVTYSTSFTNGSGGLLISFYNFNVKNSQMDVTLNGTVNASLNTIINTNAPISDLSFVADMSMNDNITKQNWLFSDYTANTTMLSDLDPPTSDVAVTGTLYNSNYGYAQVSTPSIHLRYFYTFGYLGPFTGGYLKLQGGSGAAYFGGVNYDFASVGFDPDSVGYPTEVQRFSWTNNAPDTTPVSWTAGPIAYASILKSPYVGSPGVLDGRFSYSPSGGFITFNWSVILSQPGGNAKITDPDSPTPTFSADVPGQYLVKLVVSDGQNDATDYEVIGVPSNSGVYGALANINSSGPAFIKAQLGQPVVLDGRIHSTVDINNVNLNDVSSAGEVYNWTLDVPKGSQATLSDPTSPNPSFVPDVNGYYVVMVGANLATIVDVGGNVEFTPPMQLLTFDGAGVSNMKESDLFGTGENDIVAELSTNVVGSYPYGDYAEVFRNSGNGVFQSGMVLPGDSGIAIGDLNNDHQPDIVTALNWDYADVLLQQPAGQFTLKDSLCGTSTACTPAFEKGQVWIEPFGNSVLPSVIAENSSAGLDIFSPNGSGGYQSAKQISGPGAGSYISWSFGDVTGDGNTDIVGVDDENTGSQLYVMPGNPDGSFGSAQLYQFQNDECTGALHRTSVTDLDGDGRNDVIETDNGNLLVYLQQPDGTLATPETVPLTSDVCSEIMPGIGDVNNDGLKDIVTVDGSNVEILLQDLSHNFSSITDYPAFVNNASQGIFVHGDIQVVDINGDGIPDLVFPNSVVMLGVH